MPYHKRGQKFVGIAGAIIGATVLAIGIARGQGTGEAGMQNMREMMQRMMGDRLPPGIDPKLLPDPKSRGARLLQQYCAQCHNLPGPGMHTAAEWPDVVNRMDARMRMMSGGMMGGGMMGGGMMNVHAPSAAELETLTTYLRHHAQRPIDTKRYSDLDGPAGRAFQATCAQCHALPDPAQHTAAQWPGVVARMQHNMTVMGRSAPDAETFSLIISFLERHARGTDEPQSGN